MVLKYVAKIYYLYRIITVFSLITFEFLTLDDPGGGGAYGTVKGNGLGLLFPSAL